MITLVYNLTYIAVSLSRDARDPHYRPFDWSCQERIGAHVLVLEIIRYHLGC